MIKRFLPTETTYDHNKYILKPLRAEVVEETNGMFELEIELPKGTQVNRRDIITAPTPRGVQPFRVYRITKTLQGIRAYARHIFYDLANALLLDVRPTNTNGNGALQAIINAVGWSGWSYLSDITELRTAYYIRKNPVEAIIGAENSILNTWGGNLIRNGKEVRINASGVDRGYEIRLGKNLIGIEDDSDDSNVVTRLYPTFERNQIIYGIPEGYVDSPLIGNYPTPISKEVRVALTDEQKELPDADIHDILRDYCNNLYSVDNVDKPVVNYKIDFVQLAKVSRMPQERKYTYAGLEQLTYETLQTLTYGELQGVNVIEQFTDLLEKVDLYDLVKIKVKELDIDLQARVISYRYDCLGERYSKIELGGFKPSNQYQTSNIVQQIKNEREKASEEFRELYDLAINKVTGNAGGYQITRRNANNEPYETLWMDTPDIQTAQNVLRINQNGIAGSSNGFNGPYSVAITTDGWIVAERIQAINLSAISANLGTVTAGRIEDGSGVNYWDLNSGEMNLNEIKIAGKKVSASLSEVEGDINSLELTATSLTNRISNAEGNVSTLQNTATGLTNRISNAEGNISTLQNTAQGLALDVAAADGRALNAQATADAVTLEFKGSVSGGNNILEKTDTMEQWQVFTGAILDTVNGWIHLQANGSFPYGKVSTRINRNEDYIFSVDIYTENVSSASSLATHWRVVGEAWIKTNHQISTNSGKWIRVEMPIKASSFGVADIEISVDCYGATSGEIWYRRPQLEQGTKMSGWKPNSNEMKTLTHVFDNQGYTIKDSNGAELMSLSKGVANEQNIGRVDNVEAGYPMKIPFHIGAEVSQITQAVLKWDMSQFRTYSKGAASGGGVKTTPSGGGSTSGASSRSTAENSGPATFVSNTQTELSYPNEGKHYHRITAQQMEHSHGMAHTHTTPSHVHTLDITHEHAPVFGILETGITVDYTVGIEIDGVYRAQPNATRGIIDLSTWITTNGWHELILYVNGIKRLDANLFLKTYIRR